MKSNQLNTIIIDLLLFFLIGCSSGNDEIIVQVEEENVPTVELKDKRFFINQTIAGENVAREVILRVPITLDTSRNYPVVFAFY